MPLHNSKRYVPWYIFLVTLIVSLVTFLNGLKHVGLQISNSMASMAIGLSIGFSFVIMFFGYLLSRPIPVVSDNKNHIDFQKLEKIFGILIIFTAYAMPFAHTSNDVANAIGPLAAVVGIVKDSGAVLASARIPFWIMFLGALGIVTGLTLYGYKVIASIGSNITQLTLSRGFATQISNSQYGGVVVTSAAGLPISSTQTLLGAVLGVGVARGIGSLNTFHRKKYFYVVDRYASCWSYIFDYLLSSLEDNFFIKKVTCIFPSKKLKNPSSSRGGICCIN